MVESKRAYVKTCVLVAAIATVILVCASCAPHKDASDLTLDIACNGKTFVFEGPEHQPDVPAYGASFVVQGVIYPGGTFGGDPTSGLNPNGTPEFPNLVIGTWTCRGWFIGDGAQTTTGEFVVTHQIYDLDMNHPGAKTLTSDGIELIDQGVPFDRAVTGGTGVFVDAGGQVSQEFIGSNSTGFQNFVFEFSDITVGK